MDNQVAANAGTARCPNCNNSIGCSCGGGSSIVIAIDQTRVCTKCKDAYEAKFKAQLIQSSNIQN